MNKKILYIIGVILLGGTNLCIAQELNTATAEVSDFDVKSAMNNMEELKTNLDEVVQQLYSLDEKERGDDNTISDKYRATRQEIVNVIQTINTTTEKISQQLKKIETYKKLMLLTYKDIQSSRSGMVDTKQYIEDFTNFIYKFDNKLYDKNTNTIDEIKLLINSDNIPLTLANDSLVQSMLVQLNDLMTNFQQNEVQQLETIKKLNELKSKTKESIGQYEIEIEKLQQKKNYLLQFMKLYQNDKTQRQLSINNFFESTKGVYDKTIELVKDIKK